MAVTQLSRRLARKLSRHVLDLVQPKSMRDVMEQEWKFWSASDKNNFMKFQKYFIDGVIEAAKWTDKKRAREDAVSSAVNDSPNPKKRGGQNKRNGNEASGNDEAQNNNEAPENN